MIDSRVAQLERIAAGLCAESDVAIEVSTDEWAWDPSNRSIRVSRDDLHTLGPEACAGIVAHEVGHAGVSRYLLLRSALAILMPKPELMPLFFNAIEDPRAEAHVMRKFPGVKRWLVEADSAMVPKDPKPYPRFLSFLFQAARSAHLDWALLPPNTRIAPEVLEALRITAPARRRYAEGFLPPIDDPVACHAREVQALLEEGTEASADPDECAARVLSARAASHAVSRILPAFVHLWGLDVTYIARRLSRSRSARTLARSAVDKGVPDECLRLATHHLESPAPDRVPGPNAIHLAEDLLVTAIQGMIATSMPSTCGGPARSRRGRRRAEVRVRPTPPEGGTSGYRSAYREVRSQVDLLSERLEPMLRKRTRMSERTGFATGSRLDLRKAMGFEADPRHYDELWIRKTVPDRHRAAVTLLVDLSGSMRGEKAKAALRGTIVFAETLARLSIPSAVHGFQDVLIPILGFGESLDDAARARIGDMPLEACAERPGGNNNPHYNDDGPCLAEAGRELQSIAANDRVLVVISDGSPEGVRSGPDDLKTAVEHLSASNVLLFGVGLGPGTEHVRSFYPASIASVPVEAFARTMAELLEEVIVRRRQLRRVAVPQDDQEEQGDELPVLF